AIRTLGGHRRYRESEIQAFLQRAGPSQTAREGAGGSSGGTPRGVRSSDGTGARGAPPPPPLREPSSRPASGHPRILFPHGRCAMGEFVRVEIDQAIATIRLDRPPMNALNGQVQDEIRAAAAQVDTDPAVRAVVLYGGEKVFAAGADIKEMAEVTFA